MIITVRCVKDCTLKQFHVVMDHEVYHPRQHPPPLRLSPHHHHHHNHHHRRRRPTNDEGSAGSIPGDILQHVFHFLEPKDWIQADSTCCGWRRAARPLWRQDDEEEKTEQPPEASPHFPTATAAVTTGNATNTKNPNQTKTRNFKKKPKRSEIVAQVYAEQTMIEKWNKLRGFLGRRIKLRGPATDEDIQELKESIMPFTLPSTFIASLKLHDGEWSLSKGIYLGNKLLSTSGIIQIVNRWKSQQQRQQQQSSPDNINLLRIPLFTDKAGPRQVAMELCFKKKKRTRYRNHNNNDTQTTTSMTTTELPKQHGKIVLISSVAPYAPHFKVLATSWEGFLTLI